MKLIEQPSFPFFEKYFPGAPDEVMSNDTLHWRDIHYTVVVHAYSHRLHFSAYKIIGEGKSYFYQKDNEEDDMTEDTNLAEVFASGNIKWDGCSNICFDSQENALLHFCSQQEAENVGILLKRIYILASEMIPLWADY